MVADVEERVGRLLGRAQHVHGRLRIKGLLRAHEQRRVSFGLVGVRVSDLLHGGATGLCMPTSAQQG